MKFQSNILSKLSILIMLIKITFCRSYAHKLLAINSSFIPHTLIYVYLHLQFVIMKHKIVYQNI